MPSRCMVSARVCAAILALSFPLTGSGEDRPFGLGDIVLGASYEALAAALDFRDIHRALDQSRAQGRPDLGRRGYGCLRRADEYADVTCVSHDERIGDGETREVRLHFLNGALLQFSVTAEIPRLDAIMGVLRAHHGEPHRTESAAAGGYPSWHWKNGTSSIAAWAGKDLVFVSFEHASYRAAVAARRARAAPARAP